MSFVTKYKLKETESFVSFHQVMGNQYRVWSRVYERGGRFFCVENGAFKPPEISMN